MKKEMEALHESICKAVDLEKQINNETLYKPVCIDYSWDAAISVAHVPSDKQEEFVNKVIELALTYQKPSLEVVK